MPYKDRVLGQQAARVKWQIMANNKNTATGDPASQATWGPVLLFVGLTALFAAIAYYFLIEHGLKRYYVALLMWTPGLAVIMMARFGAVNMGTLGWRWPAGRWAFLAYALPAVYGLIAYSIIWGGGFGGVVDPKFTQEVSYFLGLDGWSEGATIAFGVLMFGTVGMIWHMATALGEEIGWRGFLTPALMKVWSFPVASLAAGLVWASWHLPIIFFTSYNAGPSGLELQMLNYSILTVGLSFIMTYLRLKADSLWPAVIMHAAHNVYVLTIMQPMTVQYKETWRYANEFGFILPAVVLVFGLFFWRLAVRDGITGPTNHTGGHSGP